MGEKEEVRFFYLEEGRGSIQCGLVLGVLPAEESQHGSARI